MIDRKAVAVELLDLAINRRQPVEAFERYTAPSYRQHNPDVPDTRDGVIAWMEDWLAKHPALRYEVKQVIAEDDRVVVFAHVTSEPGTRGNAVVDILRFEGDQIVEHWDVIQPVPETMVHENGMF